MGSEGSLTVVATPIGNLSDITRRAVDLLTAADVILCEDTRRTRTLLSALDIPTAGRLVSLNEHSEAAKAAAVVAMIEEGRSVLLVSDAGMPAVSDPGARLVAEVAAAGFEVTCAPGASAVLAALVVSGLPTDRFCMEGFPARKGRERRELLAALAAEERSTVLFEAPGRVASLLADLERSLGGSRRVAVCRELTKLHEEVWRGTLADAAQEFAGRDGLRGEVVIVLAGAEPQPGGAIDDELIVEHLRASLASGLTRRDAAAAAADELGVPRRRAYEAASGLG